MYEKKKNIGMYAQKNIILYMEKEYLEIVYGGKWLNDYVEGEIINVEIVLNTRIYDILFFILVRS